MSPLDDYQDEMSRLTSEQIESILDGRPVEAPGTERLEMFVHDLRRNIVVDPEPETAARHVAAITAAARTVVPRLRPRRLTTKLAFAAALLLGAGVATAATVRLGDAPGIVPDDLPIPVRTEVEADDQVSEPPRTTDEPTEDVTERPSERDDEPRAPSARSTDGCAKAAAAAGAASAGDPCAKGGGKGEDRRDDGGPPEELPGPSRPGSGSRPNPESGGSPPGDVPIGSSGASGGGRSGGSGGAPGDVPAP